MPVRTPKAPGDYYLTGPAEDVLAAVVEVHKAGQLADVTRPKLGKPGYVATSVRVSRPRTRVRLVVIVALVVLAVVGLVAAGAAAASWAVAHGAALVGLSGAVRCLIWLYRRA